MFEDLFKVVRARFNDESEEEKSEKPSEDVDIPKDLLFKCPRCGTVVYMEDFQKNRKVCANCNYHARLTWRERLEMTADPDSFKEFDANMTGKNPIDFPDYEKKIKELQQKCGMKEAVVTGLCEIHGYPCVIGIMDSNFMMASMGSVVGEKITRAFEYATKNKEGIVSLMQMAKTSGAVARHNQAGQLYITVLTDPTTGGVEASFASLGDIIIAEPKVLIGFAGRRVIQDTIKQQLPDDFQTAEFMLENDALPI